MTLRDWRGADPAVVRDGYDRERRHWEAALAWDTSWTWTQVEQARVSTRLPGYLAVDGSGRMRGWTFFVQDGTTVHIGGLVADAPDTTELLLDGIVSSASTAEAETVACFILDRAPGLGAALARRGFAVDPFLYLSLDLRPRGGSQEERQSWRPASAGRTTIVLAESWRDDDRAAACRLLREAYTESTGVHFAADGNWERYVAGVIDQAGCGRFDPALSRVVRRAEGLDAVALVTRVAGRTAHLAQLAVAPDLRGRGLATELLRQTIEGAARAGYQQITLIVGEANTVARRVYEQLGFTLRARFAAARRPQHAALAEAM